MALTITAITVLGAIDCIAALPGPVGTPPALVGVPPASCGSDHRAATLATITTSLAVTSLAVTSLTVAVLCGLLLPAQAANGSAVPAGPPPARLSNAAPATAAAASDPLYQIGALDQLRISVYDHPELSVDVAVRPDGRISIPLIDDIEVARKTPTQVSRELEQRYAKYVQDPRVTVIIAAPVGPFDQQIRIVGNAGPPTAIPHRSGMTVLDALTTVGGISPFANGNRAVVVRRTDGVDREIPVRIDDIGEKGELATNILLQPGDIILIPEGIWNGNFFFQKTLNFTTSYSDNYRLESPGQEDPALFFTASPGMRMSGQTARFQGAAAGQVNLNYRTLSRARLQPTVDLLAQGTGELVDNEAYVDAAASITPLSTRAGEGDSAAAGNTANQSMVQTYSVSPRYSKRLNDAMTAQANYRFGTYIGGGGDASATYSNLINVGLLSGEKFNRLQWQIAGTASNSAQNGYSGVFNEVVGADLQYALTRQLSLVGGVGYQWFDGGSNSTSFNGVTWAAGFQYRPSPDASVQLTYGKRDDDRNVQGEARYRIGPFTNFTASATEFTGLQQVSLIDNLQFLSYDPASQTFIDRRSGSPFSQVPSAGSIDDQITRQKNYQATLSHQYGRNSFRVSGNISNQEALGDGGNSSRNNSRNQGGREDIVGVSGSWSRPIAPRTFISFNGSYQWLDLSGQFVEDNNNNRANPGNFQDLQQLSLIGTVSYQILENVRSYFSYGRVRQYADRPNNEYTENAFTLGLSSSF